MPILNDEREWDQWHISICATARSYGLWEYVERPSERHPALPEIPNAPCADQLNPEASHIRDLSPSELAEYQYMFTDYVEKRKRAQFQRDQLDQLRSIMVTSISDALAEQALLFDTCAETLEFLVSKGAPDTTSRRIQARQRYPQLCEGPRDQKLRTWLNDFRNAYIRARDFRIVDHSTCTEDFTSAIATVDQACSYHVALTPWPTGDQMVTTTTKQLVRAHRNPITVSQLSFATNWSKPVHDTNKSTESHMKPCICNGNHRFENCEYLVVGLGPNTVKEDQSVRDLVQKKLENPRLRSRVRKSLRKAG